MILPSVVRYLQGGRRQIGVEARDAQAEDAAHTVASVKRLMGRRLADVPGHAKLPYAFVDRPGMVAIATRDGEKTPVEVSAEILAALRQRAEDTFDDELHGAVITVPAYFDDAQRQATKDAARLAGLNVLRLLNEPTAAAVAYGLETLVDRMAPLPQERLQALEGLKALASPDREDTQVVRLRATQALRHLLDRLPDAVTP